MGNRIELIAAAQITVAAGVISFASNAGFRTASRSSPGVYAVDLEDSHEGNKLVVGITPNNLVGGPIQGSPLSTGETRTIQITNFALDGAAADTSFYLTVFRVRREHDDRDDRRDDRDCGC